MSRAVELVRAGGIASMISHCASGVSSTPSAAATRAGLGDRRPRAGGATPDRCAARRSAAGVRAVAAATGACRASFSHSTAVSLPSTRTSAPDRRRSSAVSSPASEATVITVRGVFCTITPGRSSHASMQPMLPPTTVLSGRRPRIVSMCSIPFSSGTTVSAGACDAAERIVERGRLHGDEQEVDRLAQLGRPPRAESSRPPRRASGSVPRT